MMLEVTSYSQKTKRPPLVSVYLRRLVRTFINLQTNQICLDQKSLYTQIPELMMEMKDSPQLYNLR